MMVGVTVRRYAWALLGALAASAAFPPIGAWPMALVGAALSLFALRGAGCRHGLYLGLLGGMVFYAIGLTWLWQIFGSAAIQLWLILALFHGMAGWIIGGSSRRFAGAWWLPAYVAVAWTAIEYYRSEWFWLRFPWMTHGLGLGPTWLSPWIGVYGASLLVILAAAMGVLGGRRQRAAGAGLAVVLLALAVFRPSPVIPAGDGVPVLAVQSENCDFETYLEMSRGREFSGGMIVWPEYAAPSGLRLYPEDLEKVKKLAAEKNATVVLGTIKPITPESHHNEAVTVEAAGIVGSHFKNRPVPFMNDGVRGTRAEPVVTRFGKVGTPICFDCDYVEVVRQMTAAGAEAFAVPSMDAKHWTRRQHLQHGEIFKHRALENGRWMVVCATSGQTQILDPHGNRVAEIPLMQDGLLEGRIYFSKQTTFFTRHGWRLPWIVCGVFVASSAILFGVWLKPLVGKDRSQAANDITPVGQQDPTDRDDQQNEADRRADDHH